jgi:hypothetical protein
MGPRRCQHFLFFGGEAAFEPQRVPGPDYRACVICGRVRSCGSFPGHWQGQLLSTTLNSTRTTPNHFLSALLLVFFEPVRFTEQPPLGLL